MFKLFLRDVHAACRAMVLRGLRRPHSRHAWRKAARALAKAEPSSRYARLPDDIETIRQKARAGHVLEQVQWGQILRESVYMPPRPDLAFKWFESAALAGFGPGLNMLGRCYQFGWGCTLDLLRAAACYEQAAVRGDVWGCYNLAILTMRGLGVEQDLSRALCLFQAGAQAGHAKSMNLYARFLEEGWEIAQDRVMAEHWYRRSAESGDYRGQHNYATLLCDRGEYDKALEWWRRAASEATSDILLAMRSRLEIAGIHGDTALLDLVCERLAGLERMAR
ncbi:tetratricopeptide repeat protein [Asaia lannensis]|uniref:Sel1 repeat family protein n=1 Tax=Asaia lannensis NBRC 102526 TaxID=1307926 RepID=A0ABT1CJA8_9PROT|nr:tetratricopeptide repeat protein [Asaia lannensis]MCO6160288.1 sel1 repeat family protein [Asaia lannensis NBRC 102526]